MDWLDPKDLLDSGECVVRLVNPVTAHGEDASFWWGKSVHQIAHVDVEGEVWSHGRRLRREAINGWMPLPRGER